MVDSNPYLRPLKSVVSVVSIISVVSVVSCKYNKCSKCNKLCVRFLKPGNSPAQFVRKQNVRPSCLVRGLLGLQCTLSQVAKLRNTAKPSSVSVALIL